jgi:hypothetical protein
LENEHKILSIGILLGVTINIYGVRSVANFEVIDIMDNIQPYLVFLGLDWAFDNHTIINFNKREMIFGVGGLKVTTPLDPTEARRYAEPAIK